MRTVYYVAQEKFDASKWFSTEAYTIEADEMLIIVLDFVHLDKVLRIENNKLYRVSREEHVCVLVQNMSREHEIKVDSNCSFDKLAKLSELSTTVCRIKLEDLLKCRNT
jgi:hypothetical protein